jgi:acetyl esterase/lipase
VDPNLSSLACSKVLVNVAEKDWLKDRGVAYYETLGKSGWGGTVELLETKGEDHCFHLFNANNENAKTLLKKLVDFIIGD